MRQKILLEKMKTILSIFGILCILLVDVSCQSIEEEMDHAFEHCLQVFNVTVNEFATSEVDLTCFDTCVATNAEIIKDKKFNLEKYTQYLVAIEDPHYAKEIISAFEHCVERMLDIEDECESYVQLEKCVDKKLGGNYKKN